MESIQQTPTTRPPFGRWLQTRPDRHNWTDQLSAAARSDRGFPQSADVDAVRRYLTTKGATSEAFEQLDDAELDWLAR